MKNFVIGSGIISFKYRDGIITCADTQASYGNLCKFNNVSRLHKLGNNTLICLSGEISDIQNLIKLIKNYTDKDPVEISTNGYCKLIQRILYAKRSKVEPLNVSVNIMGIDDKMILGNVDHLGNYYYDDIIATGLSSMIALPFLREQLDDKELSKEEAIKIAEDAMRIMCYRSCRNSNQIQMGVIDKDGVYISSPYTLSTKWDVAYQEGEIIIE